MQNNFSVFLRWSLPILKFSAPAAILVFLMIYGYHSIGTSVRPQSVHQDTTPTALTGCSHVDDSFCQTEHDIKQFMAAQSAPDLFERQVSTNVICDGSPAVQSYCGTASSGIQLRLNAITQGGNQILLQRNKYILLVKDYFMQHKPITFASTTKSGTGITMMFNSKTPDNGIRMQFEQINMTWKITTLTLEGS